MVTLQEFQEAFQQDEDGREFFTAGGQIALYNYLINNKHMHIYTFPKGLKGDAGVEVCVVDLCEEFTEYQTLEELQGDYGADIFPDMKHVKDVMVVIEVDEKSFIVFDWFAADLTQERNSINFFPDAPKE